MIGEKSKKTHYFSKFALKHFGAMKILANGGVLGRGNEDWRNVAEHCLVEAVGADILAEALGADRGKVTHAALIHDWYKRREVEAMKAHGGGAGYKATAGEDERLLREYGVPEDVICIAHANIPEAADAEYLEGRSLEEKIMHLLDMITSGSEFMDYEERLRVVMRKKHNVEFMESFRAKYNGKNLAEVQRIAIAQEQKEFEEKLRLKTGALLDFLRGKLERRIVHEG